MTGPDVKDEMGNSLAGLQAGDLVRIPFGSRGSSKARFVRWGKSRDGKVFLIVERYIEKSDKWTKETPIYPNWVMGRIAMVKEAA